MRDLSLADLSRPEPYAEDAELAALARRIGVARWRVDLGVSLEEWKRAHLRGEHPGPIRCALDALAAQERREKERALTVCMKQLEQRLPQGWVSQVEGDQVYLSGPRVASLGSRLRRLGARWDSASRRWSVPLDQVDSLGRVFGAAMNHHLSLPEHVQVEHRRQAIERWLCWVETKANQGWVYARGVKKLHELGIQDHPELSDRLAAALVIAATKSGEPDGAAGGASASKSARRLPRRLFPLASAPPLDRPVGVDLGRMVFTAGSSVVFTGSTRPFRITDSHPKAHGEYLRPFVGELGAYFYYRSPTKAELDALDAAPPTPGDVNP